MNDNQWDKAVRKLIRLTQNGELTWARSPDNIYRDNIIGCPFVTEVQSRKTLVYEYCYDEYDDSSCSDSSDEESENEVAIEFIDSEGQIEYRWPATPSRWELLDAIQFQIADITDFLTTFLEDDDELCSSDDQSCE